MNKLVLLAAVFAVGCGRKAETEPTAAPVQQVQPPAPKKPAAPPAPPPAPPPEEESRTTSPLPPPPMPPSVTPKQRAFRDGISVFCEEVRVAANSMELTKDAKIVSAKFAILTEALSRVPEPPSVELDELFRSEAKSLLVFAKRANVDLTLYHQTLPLRDAQITKDSEQTYLLRVSLLKKFSIELGESAKEGRKPKVTVPDK